MLEKSVLTSRCVLPLPLWLLWDDDGPRPSRCCYSVVAPACIAPLARALAGRAGRPADESEIDTACVTSRDV